MTITDTTALRAPMIMRITPTLFRLNLVLVGTDCDGEIKSGTRAKDMMLVTNPPAAITANPFQQQCLLPDLG